MVISQDVYYSKIDTKAHINKDSILIFFILYSFSICRYILKILSQINSCFMQLDVFKS